MWAPDISTDRIHDETVASIGPQSLLSRIEISENWYQIEIQWDDSEIAPYKNLNASEKKTKLAH